MLYHHDPPPQPLDQSHGLWNVAFMLQFKVLVKSFTSLYLLNFKMALVYTLLVVRYWSEVLCCTIMTHLSNFQVKVMDFEIWLSYFRLKFFVKVFRNIYLLHFKMDLVETLLVWSFMLYHHDLHPQLTCQGHGLKFSFFVSGLRFPWISSWI